MQSDVLGVISSEGINDLRVVFLGLFDKVVDANESSIHIVVSLIHAVLIPVPCYTNQLAILT